MMMMACHGSPSTLVTLHSWCRRGNTSAKCRWWTGRWVLRADWRASTAREDRHTTTPASAARTAPTGSRSNRHQVTWLLWRSHVTAASCQAVKQHDCVCVVSVSRFYSHCNANILNISGLVQMQSKHLCVLKFTTAISKAEVIWLLRRRRHAKLSSSTPRRRVTSVDAVRSNLVSWSPVRRKAKTKSYDCCRCMSRRQAVSHQGTHW